MLQKIVDPNEKTGASLPRDLRTLKVLAMNYRLLVFDNCSGHLDQDVSDAFCKLVTGGSFSDKANYTDDELSTFAGLRPIIISSIDDSLTRSDAIDRALFITVNPRKSYKTAEYFSKEFDEKVLPETLDALYTILALTLAILPVRLPYEGPWG
jgi:putative DNA primase/helicase